MRLLNLFVKWTEDALSVTGKAMTECLYVCAVCQAGLTEVHMSHSILFVLSLKPKDQQAGLKSHAQALCNPKHSQAAAARFPFAELNMALKHKLSRAEDGSGQDKVT